MDEREEEFTLEVQVFTSLSRDDARVILAERIINATDPGLVRLGDVIAVHVDGRTFMP